MVGGVGIAGAAPNRDCAEASKRRRWLLLGVARLGASGAMCNAASGAATGCRASSAGEKALNTTPAAILITSHGLRPTAVGDAAMLPLLPNGEISILSPTGEAFAVAGNAYATEPGCDGETTM